MGYTPVFDTILVGDPQAPTPSFGDNDTSLATTAYVQAELATFLPLAGGTMVGNLVFDANVDAVFNDTASGLSWSDIRIDRAGPNVLALGSDDKIQQAAAPVADSDLANKQYVDSVATGLDVKQSVRAVTTTALPAYTRTDNVITATSDGAFPTIDSVTIVEGDRILLKNGAGGQDNGIYVLIDAGSVSSPFVLERAPDADEDFEVNAGMFTFVEEGTINANTGWVLTTNNPVIVNSTPLSFTKFSSAVSVSTLGDLTDVTISGPVDGALLRYEATGTEWNNTATLLFNDDGQLQVTTTGSSAGIVLGGDAQLYRGDADQLRTDDDLVVGGQTEVLDTLTANDTKIVSLNHVGTTQPALEVLTSTDSDPRVSVLSGGTIEWGSGTGASDTSLYRSGASELTVGAKARFSAAQRVATKTVTANYTVNLNEDHVILVDNSANTSNLQVTLPDTHAEGDLIHIKDAGGTSGSSQYKVLVVTAGSDTIDGSGQNFELLYNYQSVTFVSDGTNWFAI